MLPNVNTIESVVVDTPEHREWLAQGKHWTPHVQAPGLIDKQAWTVDKMREVWLNPGKPTGVARAAELHLGQVHRHQRG